MTVKMPTPGKWRTRKSARHGPATGFEENTGHAPQRDLHSSVLGAKEIQDRHTVLSERAVLIRVHRIMQRLQNVALALSAKTNCPNDGVEQETPNEAKKTVRT